MKREDGFKTDWDRFASGEYIRWISRGNLIMCCINENMLRLCMEDDMSNNYNGMEIDSMGSSYAHEKGLAQYKGEKDYADTWNLQDSKYSTNGRVSGYSSDTDGRDSKSSSKPTTTKQRAGFLNSTTSNGFSLRNSGGSGYFRRK